MQTISIGDFRANLLKYLPRQKNLWATFGVGKSPSA